MNHLKKERSIIVNLWMILLLLNLKISSALGFEMIGWILTDPNNDIAMDSRMVRQVIFSLLSFIKILGCLFSKPSYCRASHWHSDLKFYYYYNATIERG